MGRNSGGVRGGGGGGLAGRVASGFSSDQKTVFNQLTAGGLDKGYSAYLVGGAWKESFKNQPMQYIQGVLAAKALSGKDQKNALLKQKVNADGLKKALKGLLK